MDPHFATLPRKLDGCVPFGAATGYPLSVTWRAGTGARRRSEKGGTAQREEPPDAQRERHGEENTTHRGPEPGELENNRRMERKDTIGQGKGGLLLPRVRRQAVYSQGTALSGTRWQSSNRTPTTPLSVPGT
ncbi:hypothetical protein GGTG_08044 [Gaeumannomyces tritici R3-111a-1]|uniref:Uncharacterized protein n=1 Tax=Gaeumannomyces tritici (strain R3-111a-1) TaxID=644352 RepID=J3P3F8_GAET3|nr:hypothetical protein GGTG_08044 [Gaeumannomyces tritici R3-111a-1]EJT74200.1 hypothetical protein GGTG_08044 [Gaeumannomyces tritici R3-111a-1]